MENIENRLKTLEEKMADVEKQIQSLPDKVINRISQGLSNEAKSILSSLLIEQENERETEKIKLNDKDIDCIARIFQSLIFAQDEYYGCQFCKYFKECSKSFMTTEYHTNHFDIVLNKLQKTTQLGSNPGEYSLRNKFKKQI